MATSVGGNTSSLNSQLLNKMDTMNVNLDRIAQGVSGYESTETWDVIQGRVRNNTISGFLIPGDTVNVTENNSNVVYEIEGINEENPSNPFLSNVLSLVRKDVYGTLVPFDPSSLLFSVTSAACTYFGWTQEGMPPGTYNITLNHGAYSGGTEEDGTYQFTTTSLIPVGGGIRHSYMGTSQSGSSVYEKAKVLSGTFITYSANRKTVIEQGIVTAEGSSGTNLGTTTSKDPQYKSGDFINFTQRQRYGSNRWATSFIRQWLNSAEEDFTFKPGTIWSMPSTGVTSGFLFYLDADLVKVLGKVKKRYALSLADGYGYEDVEDAVTLPTVLDVYGQQNNSIAEGAVDQEGNITRSNKKSLWREIYKTNDSKIKRSSSVARSWWLSSTSPSYAYYERSVGASGSLGNYSAYNSYGAAPVLHII